LKILGQAVKFFSLEDYDCRALPIDAQSYGLVHFDFSDGNYHIDMVLIENIVDEFECAAREGEELDYEDIEDAAESLIHKIPFAGLGE